MTACTFDPERHEYRIGERKVVGVTTVLNDLIPGYRASEFYLGKGRAVHAAAAFVAKGIAFEHDPRIAGQVEAVRKFFREIQPEVVEIEQPVYSKRYLYGGTPDLVAIIAKRPLIVDYKSYLVPSAMFQCAAYALAFPHSVNYGVCVALHQDGTYAMSETWPLKRPTQEWLAMLTTYRIRERLGCLIKEDEDHE